VIGRMLLVAHLPEPECGAPRRPILLASRNGTSFAKPGEMFSPFEEPP
jgi:hypothetical protein